jgi:LacI family transcriptional regulator
MPKKRTTPAKSERRGAPAARPTVKDVARIAKVSVGTVSRVINGNKTVGEDIRTRVQDVMTRLKFLPDATAQGMRSKSKRTVGIIIRDITVPALAGFVRAAQNVFLDAGYTLVIGCSDDSVKRELELLESLQRRVDGLVMSTATETDPQLVRMHNALEIPIVLLDREAAGPIDSVVIAQRDGTYQAVRHLLALGHTRIALVTGPTSVLSARERIRGYEEAHAESGTPVQRDLVRSHSFTAGYAYESVSGLLGGANRPTAVVAGGISMLTGILRAVSTEKLRIPEDISIVGCGDSDLAELTTPPITVIRWKYDAIGEAAAHMVIDRIQDPTLAPRKLKFPTELILRSSCSRPPPRLAG